MRLIDANELKKYLLEEMNFFPVLIATAIDKQPAIEMKMIQNEERLTTRPEGVIIGCFGCTESEDCYCNCSCNAVGEVAQKLKYYEDLEESGRLIILPSQKAARSDDGGY